MTLTVLATTVI